MTYQVLAVKMVPSRSTPGLLLETECPTFNWTTMNFELETRLSSIVSRLESKELLP